VEALLSPLTLLVLIPVMAMGLGFFLPASQPRLHKALGILAGATCLGIAMWLFYVASTGGEQALKAFSPPAVPWVASLGISWKVGVDGMSVVLCLLTGFVLFTATLVSAQSIKTDVKNFFLLVNALVSGVFGVFVVRDMFFMYFAFELAVVPMYLLIAVWGSSKGD